MTRAGTWVLLAISATLSLVLSALLFLVRHTPAPGDISQALSQHPEMYKLSLGHMTDLTLNAFAYLKLPLALAALAFGGMAISLFWLRRDARRMAIALAAGMVLFFQAARIALVRFDPYLGSHALAQALTQSPPGQLISDGAYYEFSSVYFYSGRDALILNGRKNNLEYGSYAPNAPQVFIDDSKFVSLWSRPERYYLLAAASRLSHLQELVGREHLFQVQANGTNYLLTNQPLH